MDRREFLGTAGAAALIGAAGLSPARAQAAKVTLVQAGPALAFAGLYVATNQKLWAKNGIDPTVKRVNGGPLALTALSAGEAEFATLASSDVVIAAQRDLPVVSVAAVTTALVLGIGARNDWMKSKGLTPKSPIEAKIKALKGASIGVATVGGGPAQYGRYLMQAYGLDPKADAQFLPVGQTATRIAALREGRTDVFIGAPPEAEIVEQEGFGAMFVNLATEVPQFRDYAFTVIITTRDYAAKNEAAVRSFVKTLAEANRSIHGNFASAVEAMKAEHKQVSPKAVEIAMQRFKSGYPNGARQTESMWKSVIASMKETGAIQKDISAAEGGVWTNKYL
jgi:ABC-type nitrate/sulfonate/bicarbonate transport system substrate-binding protein